MVRSLVVGAALTGLSLAAGPVPTQSTSTVSLLLPLFDRQSFVGSVVQADPKVTTFAIACPSGVDAANCGLPGTQTFLQGPSTWFMSFGLSASGSEGGTYTQAADCVLNPDKNLATCHAAVTQNARTGRLQTQSETVITGYSTMMLPVTITAGLDKLAAATNAAATTISGNAAAPLITHNAVLAGMVTAVGGALML